MKKTLLAAALVAAAASAQADTKFYGHAAYAAKFGDSDAVATDRDYAFTRYAFSESRWGVNFSKKAGGIKWLALLEFGIDGDGEDEADSRRQAFGISGGFGKILFGQYNDVGDGVLHADLAGTVLADPMASSSAGVAGEVQDNDAAAGFNGDINVNGFDPGRGEALRYWTPKLGGIATIGAQLEENEAFEVALKLNAAGFRLYGFYNDNGDNTGYDNRFGALVGYKAPFGLSVTGVFSTNEALSGDETDHAAIKVGYAIGKHKLSYKYQVRELASGDETEEGVLAWAYSPTKGVNLFAAIKGAESDIAGDTEDGTAIGIGGRVKF